MPRYEYVQLVRMGGWITRERADLRASNLHARQSPVSERLDPAIAELTAGRAGWPAERHTVSVIHPPDPTSLSLNSCCRIRRCCYTHRVTAKALYQP